MSTTTLTTSNRQLSRLTRTKFEGIHIGRLGLGTVGFGTVLIAAWGGVIPYVGPLFGYSADGSGSWHWSLAHTLVALVPGAVGVLVGLAILAEVRGIRVGRGRLSLAFLGLLAVLAGAWFVVVPMAWPVLTSHATYFAVTNSTRMLANVIGSSFGPGLILAAFGAYAMGWASRHQERASIPATAGVAPIPEL